MGEPEIKVQEIIEGDEHEGAMPVKVEERIEFGTASQSLIADPAFKVPEGLIRYNLACGQQKKEGFKGIDKVAGDNVDLVHDLMIFPWPIESGSVYEFNCEHFVEHIPIVLLDGSYGLPRFMEEVYRCLMPGGMIRIVSPHYMSQEAWQDPTHCRAITDITFAYFNRDVMKGSGLEHYTGECDFEQISRTRLLDPAWGGKSDEARNWAMKHYWNVIKEITFVLRKRIRQ